MALELDEDEAFFLWQVPPTVIFGRNQLMEAEVNVDFCRQHNINLFRRKSGGGCVYADMGNIMLSCITGGDNIPFVFDSYLRRIAFLLQKLGIDAKVSGRNDIMVADRKISGNAFLKYPKKCIIHGTMLYDSDFEQLEKAITPSSSKLESKGVASVRKHVANLREFTDIGIEEFKAYLIEEMCRGEERVLTESEVHRIEEIEATYLEESFFAGKNPAYSITKSGKIKDVGEINMKLEMKHGILRQISISGDFFPIKADFEEALNQKLGGSILERNTIADALRDFDMGEYVLNLTNDQFIEILLKP